MSAVRVRSGAALLEAILALAIFATAGMAAAALASESAHAVRQASARDLEIRHASAFMDAVALWTRDDLDRRLGERQQGVWRLRIDRPAPTIYTASLLDEAGAPLLRTALFRPYPVHDSP